MRRSLIALGATALLAVGACSGTAATPAPTTAPVATAAPASAAPASAAAGGEKVSIKNFSFNPAAVDAKAGDTITWTNGDETAHTVTFDDASVTSSGNVDPSSTFSTTIAKAGTYTYHCKIHPTMKGTITVS